jgi:hypothetical protein
VKMGIYIVLFIILETGLFAGFFTWW